MHNHNNPKTPVVTACCFYQCILPAKTDEMKLAEAMLATYTDRAKPTIMHIFNSGNAAIRRHYQHYAGKCGVQSVSAGTLDLCIFVAISLAYRSVFWAKKTSARFFL